MAPKKTNQTTRDSKTVHAKKQPKPKRVQRPGRKLHPKLDFHYLAALTNPFSRVATGAKIPSIVPLGTTTQKLVLRGTVFTDSLGTALVTISPNPMMGARSWPYGGGVPNGIPFGGDVTNIFDPSGTGFVSIASPPGVLAAFSKFRLVSYGVRISSAVSDAENGGICAYGTDMLGTSLRRWYVASGAAGVAPALTTLAVDANYNIGDAFADVFGEMNLPDSNLFSGFLDVNQLTPNRVPIESLRTKSRVIIGQAIDDNHQLAEINCVGGAAGPQGRPEWDRAWSHMDHKTVCLHISGAKPSIAALDVEIVYHLEHFDTPKRSIGGMVGPIAPPANNQPGSKEYTKSVAATQPSHFVEDAEVAAGGAALTLAAPELAGAAGGLWGAITGFGSDLVAGAVAALPSIMEAAPLLLLA